HDWRILRQHHRHPDALPLATRERRHITSGKVVSRCFLQRFPHLLPILGGRFAPTPQRAPVGVPPTLHQLPYRQPRRADRMLRQERDEPSRLAGAQAVDVLIPDEHPPLAGNEKPGQRLEQGGLATAIGSKQSRDLPRLRFKRDILNDAPVVAVAGRHVLDSHTHWIITFTVPRRAANHTNQISAGPPIIAVTKPTGAVKGNAPATTAHTVMSADPATAEHNGWGVGVPATNLAT